MKILPNNKADHIKVIGRDIVESKVIRNVTQVDTVIQALKWLEPYVIGESLMFRKGVSYQTGEYPSGANDPFPSGKRICLIETMTPVIEVAQFSYGGAPTERIVFNVSEVLGSSRIGIIPSPYYGTTATVLIGDGSSPVVTPEIGVTVLAYLDSANGLAIGERLRYTKPANPDILSVNRYPYIIDAPLSGYSLSEAADEYYYNETDYQAAEDALP